MKNIGSILSFIGGLIVVTALLAAIFIHDFRVIWEAEFSETPGLPIVAGILAIMIMFLAYLSFSSQPRLLGTIIIAASFAGIIVGSTLMDIAMLFSAVGGFALYTSPKAVPEAKEPPKPEPALEEPETTPPS